MPNLFEFVLDRYNTAENIVLLCVYTGVLGVIVLSVIWIMAIIRRLISFVENHWKVLTVAGVFGLLIVGIFAL
jgi:phosphate starvation-inducible membrane PsiE